MNTDPGYRLGTGQRLGIVFDLDGVLIDSFSVMREAFLIAYAEVVGNDRPPFEEYSTHLGRYFPDIMRIMGLPLEMEAPFVRESERLAHLVRVHDGVREVVSALRGAGHRLAVATGKSGPRARSLLDRLGLIDQFDVVIGSDEVPRPKPAGDIVLHALSVLEVEAEDAMMIGDAVTDLASARAAGVTAVAALWGTEGDPSTLLNAGPDVVLDTPAGLLALCSPVESANPGCGADVDTAQRVEVDLGSQSYSVHIGPGVRHLLADIVAGLGARRVAVVSARPTEWLPDPGVESVVLAAQDGEADKVLATVEFLCGRFADFGLTRSDAVVSCGGGTTTDVVGLAAALYHRGLPVVHLPTTLLAQVDASVGGKTAVNLPTGKNLVGAYWQPAAVLCDTDYLRTLPQREWINGYGEIARAHFIGAGDLRGLPTATQIAASVARKAEIVARDERDSGLRHLLNYGHTLGHALERATDFRIRHGEAVAIGTVFAGRLAGALGRIGTARVAEHLDVVRGYGLPSALPADVDPAALLALMRLDKKATDGLTFVLDGPAGAELVRAVPADVVAEVLGRMPVAPEDSLIATGSRGEEYPPCPL
jgi:5-deoxy-5-amino-3-dehydroquinate synthase